MENKNNGGLIGIIVVLLLIVIGLSGFIIYDKVLNPTNNQNNGVSGELDDNVNDLEEDKDEIKNDNSCVIGTYYGEYRGTSSTNNTITYDFRHRYTFNEDGTYTADFNGVSGENGMYTFNNGVLTVTHLQETGVGEVTNTLAISSDCSYIAITSSDVTFNLNKQKD